MTIDESRSNTYIVLQDILQLLSNKFNYKTHDDLAYLPTVEVLLEDLYES